jgi:peptidyl-prolyl cis-trans isomerase C
MEFYHRVLDDLIGAELLFQESRKRALELSDEETEAALTSLKSRLPDPAMFEQVLASEGLTIDALRSQIHRDQSIQKLIDADITPNVKVSADQTRKYYDENTELMKQPDRLRLSHILKRVEPDATPEAKASARTEIEAILERARAGEDFAALARENSDDPGSAANGGELTVSRGDTVPPFEEAAFALSPGELSPVVETQFGFHVIKLTEKLEGQVVPYNQVAPRIQEFLTQQAIQDEVGEKVDALRASGDVEILLDS